MNYGNMEFFYFLTFFKYVWIVQYFDEVRKRVFKH